MPKSKMFQCHFPLIANVVLGLALGLILSGDIQNKDLMMRIFYNHQVWLTGLKCSAADSKKTILSPL